MQNGQPVIHKDMWNSTIKITWIMCKTPGGTESIYLLSGRRAYHMGAYDRVSGQDPPARPSNLHAGRTDVCTVQQDD